MALKGNLRDFTITQLLNLINLARKTGTLVVEGADEMISLSFREGKLAYAQVSREESSLVHVLYQARKLTPAQQRALSTRAAHMSDKELGLLLINANYLSQQDVLVSLQSYFLNIVNRLFTWAEGLFRFENELMPPDGKITLRIGLENIILEGSRRLKETEQLQDELPDLDMALKFAARPGVNANNLNLNADEWKVVSFINPKNSIRQIARANKLSDFEIRRIVYGLLQAGLVEIVHQEGAPPLQIPLPTQAPLTKTEQQQKKSLLHRLIDRIRAL